MSDDKEPQGPSNPFIKFKNHVNARIGAGLSLLTGATDNRDRSLPKNPAHLHDSSRSALSSPWPSRNQGPGTYREQSRALNFWDDWCLVDPYSPHNLRHLSQPTPKDLPSGADSADFGFHEAFEDLMSVSNPFPGQLMDLGLRARMKESVSGRLAQPETSFDWVRRLYENALLPPPFMWEQPRFAGGVPMTWPARGEQPAGGMPHAWEAFEAAYRAQHDNNAIGDVARAYLEVMRNIDEGYEESFSKFEEILGREMAELIRTGRTLAEKAADAFSGESSANHDARSSGAATHDGAKPESVSEKDQPDTEEDLFEMIQSATAAANKFFSSFDLSKERDRARQTPARAERIARDVPPVKETVEYDPSGAKTIRTSSEHVDAFGFIHSRTEVRRLNAKGETVDYNTRYSVRSSSDGPRESPRQGEYQPRCVAPVSILLTPEQYSAFIRKSSDEQLESFRASPAEDDEATLDPENLAVKNQQMQLILEEQQRRASSRSQPVAGVEASARVSGGAPQGLVNHALQDYQMHLMHLEKYNKQLSRAQREEEEAAGGGDADVVDGQLNLQAYEKHFRVLEEERKERLRRAKEEEAAPRPAPEKPQESANSKSSGWFWR